MNCQICGSTASLAFTKNNFRILRCKTCNHHFTELVLSPEKVNEIYSDSYFYDGGDGYSDYTMEGGLLIEHGEYYAKKISKFISSGTVLDIGAAAGFILKGFINMGWQGTGVEPNAKMVEYGIKTFGIDYIPGTFESIKPTQKFDLITMVQVIAHLFDLKLSLEKTSASLHPGGYLLIETWNTDSMTAKILSKYWHEYSPPSTLNFFSKKSLDVLMESFGFQKISSGRPQKKIIGNHAKTLLKHKMNNIKFLNKLSRIFDIIPDKIQIRYPAEDLFWALYRKDQ